MALGSPESFRLATEARPLQQMVEASYYAGFMTPIPWKVSLHGGHSGQFCEHAEGTLREILEAAARAGFAVYGISEHAPRPEPRFLYASERAKGYSVERLEREFDDYARQSRRLQAEFDGKLAVLRGFETEAVPSRRYGSLMREFRERHGFDYVVGSVHHVEEISIDESPALYRVAVEACGGVEPFFETYFRLVREMIEEIRPEVVGHIDLPRLHAPAGADIKTARIREAAEAAIEAARCCGSILDLNTAAWRKGLKEPYPSPWLIRLAREAGVPFCFGDDSHRPSQVGFGLDRARDYLLSNGVKTVTILEPGGGETVRREVRIQS